MPLINISNYDIEKYVQTPEAIVLNIPCLCFFLTFVCKQEVKMKRRKHSVIGSLSFSFQLVKCVSLCVCILLLFTAYG